MITRELGFGHQDLCYFRKSWKAAGNCHLKEWLTYVVAVAKHTYYYFEHQDVVVSLVFLGFACAFLRSCFDFQVEVFVAKPSIDDLLFHWLWNQSNQTSFTTCGEVADWNFEHRHRVLWLHQSRESPYSHDDYSMHPNYRDRKLDCSIAKTKVRRPTSRDLSWRRSASLAGVAWLFDCL